MSRRMFKVISLLVLLSMLVVPVSAKPTTSNLPQGTSQTPNPDSKLQLEAVDPSQVKQVGNPNAVVKGEIKGAASEANYIVQLADPALASYRGGITGLNATSPAATGAVKLDAKSANSQAYVSYLVGQQAQALNAINAALGRQAVVLFQYQYAFNGFALKLTPAEAAVVAKMPGVSNVWRETIATLDTDAGPTWIGAAGIWGGTTTGGLPATKGEGIIAGILDTGINHDHPSFAAVGGDEFVTQNPLGTGNFLGWCDTQDPTFCNDKLIGAWDFVYSVTPAGMVDYPSPEDENSHGSHTASTVAGNVVDATLIAPTLEYTKQISGVAPHANLIAYDICYTNPADNSGLCPGSSSLAAANQALADGVDVINFSIGGGADPYNDPTELAFLALFEAGVFVSTSAGNSGPDPATLGHQSPWVSTTAAATHNRTFPNFLTDMAGGSTTPPADIKGLGFTDGYGPADIVYAGDYGDPLCPIGAFPADTFAGEIVVCDRGGGYARVDKAQSVANGGAGGFVLANDADSGSSLVGDAYVIPGVHITYDDGVDLKAWLATGTGHTATISGIIQDLNPANGDILASFSSRGPNTALDIVKPNTTTPGVDIWAAYKTPNPANPGVAEYGFMSGTSMASPHNAGAGALMRALYPGWTVAEIMSAIMATADTSVLKEDGVTPANTFDMGSGRDNLLESALAGFVLDETATNMEAANPADGGDPRTLNLPSMANSECLSSCSWTRTLKSTLDYAAEWAVTTSSPDGVVITVSDSNIVLPAGGSQDLTITATVGGLPTGDWLFGSVLFSEVVGSRATQAPDMHFPLAVVPSTGVLPNLVEIATRRNAGSQLVKNLQSLEITDLTTENFGLVQATLTSRLLSQDPTNGNPFDNFNDGTTFFITTVVPANALRLVAEITVSESPDLDMYVGLGTVPSEASLVCTSAGATAFESCNIADPAAGTYWILVQDWAQSGTPPDLVTLASAVVTAEDLGNMMIEGPTSVPALEPFDLRVFWDTPTMKAGDRWYGAFSLGTDAGHPGNIATIPVNVIRDSDDVTKTANTTMVEPGDTVTYTITVEPNITPEDLNYMITDTIPAGLTYKPGSASATGGTVNVVGDTVEWDVSMPVPTYNYAMSTSEDNPLCDTGFDGYVHLSGYGIFPNAAVSGDSKAWTTFSSGNPFNYYGQSYQGMGFTDDGFAIFDVNNNYGGSPWFAQDIPDPAEPNNVLAMFWQDMEIFYNLATNSGVSLATLGAPGGWAIVEYDNIQFYGGSADNFDFEVVAARAVDDTPGAYEFVFAYDGLNGDLTGPMTVGLENALGDKAVALVNDGDATGVLSNGFMVCFDYQAFGVDPAVLTYAATVNADADLSSGLTNHAVHDTDNPGSLPAVASVTIFMENPYYLPLISKNTP